ncbi:alpha/beta hydrolase [Hyphomonas sp.]|uniref:alpha/beta fold hydrolase n=1 Tax=Hyphomonas sp. TaxID=87 RepID=UPI00333FC22E
MILFVHGVPDTAILWDPLINALGLEPGVYRALSLPGFGNPVPKGFSGTKDAYAGWLVKQMEAAGEPVHLVGHNWGALLVLRAASMRPELVSSWCVTNALIDKEYSGHRTARMWATPILGELVMLGMRNKARLEPSLVEGGMPASLAKTEVPHIDKTMRQSILKLYRSALGLSFRGAWVDDLAKLPKRGQLFWGETDPFVDLSVAERFSKQWGTPLHVARGAGHWACHERAEEFAGLLAAHWSR